MIIYILLTFIPITIGISGIYKAKRRPEPAESRPLPASGKRIVWFWTGLVLLSLSAFVYLLLILIAVFEGTLDIQDAIIAVTTITGIPVGIGIFGVWYGARTGPHWSVFGKLTGATLVCFCLLIFMSFPESAKDPVVWSVAIGVPVAMFGIPTTIIYLAQRIGTKR